MKLDRPPLLYETITPPLIAGSEALAVQLARATNPADILAPLQGPFATESELLAATFDTATFAFLSGQRNLGIALQKDVLAQCRLFRIARPATAPDTGRTLRVLGFAAPGDLQMNLPVEFLTAHLDVRLDVLFVLPEHHIPTVVPPHDVAICLVAEGAPETRARLAALLTSWPRPVLNHPSRAAGGATDLSRAAMARMLADVPGLHVPALRMLERAEIRLDEAPPAPLDWPILVRPEGSHAGADLALIPDGPGLAACLARSEAARFHLTQFVDYRSPDGLFRKYRVALIAGRPFLCHMAASAHWMIHYVNAGMHDCATKRADEARAFREFDAGVARRHAAALAGIHDRLGLDYVLLDCAESPDGRLLLFEVELAAIAHDLDPPDLFPYKRPQMRRVFDAFGALLAAAAALTPSAARPFAPVGPPAAPHPPN